ncbi:Superoxide dismutase copper/zinc binding domain [Trinorchestia longiramus]|nr:Superoxide dismutase copper/zinc binding domain [Trinorchestia longiramus]
MTKVEAHGRAPLHRRCFDGPALSGLKLDRSGCPSQSCSFFGDDRNAQIIIMRSLLLLLLVSVALAAPQGEENPPAASSPPAENEGKMSEAPVEEEEAVTEAASAGNQVKSSIGSRVSLEKLAEDFEGLEESGGLPVVVPNSSSVTDEKFGAKVNIFGVEVPVIVLAKLGLAIVAAAASAIGGGGTAAAAAALGSGVSFPDASDPAAVSRILKETTSTASAIFDGAIVGEVHFAQAIRPEGERKATVITAKFTGVPAGTYQLQVRESGNVGDACANVGPRYSTDTSTADAVLGSLLVDEGGQASAILSRGGINLTGSPSILGRSVALVSSDADAEPVACAVIVRQ